MGEDAKKSDAEYRSRLTPLQFHVTREAGTEPPFTGAYVHNKDEGLYRCICCGAELFASDTKFESGTGWPSFYQAHDPTKVLLREDRTHGMRRVEVRCARCDAHLGHLFPDGPRPTGQRFCINSAALQFDKKEP